MFKVYETLCPTCVCETPPDPPVIVCPGVNLISNIPTIGSDIGQFTLGFTFQPLFNVIKITSVLFPIIQWTGEGDKREYAIWNSNTQEILLQGTINKITDKTEGIFYVKTLDTPYELNKDILYVYGALLESGDVIASPQVLVYTNPVFKNIVTRINQLVGDTLIYPEKNEDADGIFSSFFRYSCNIVIGCE